MTSSGPGFTLNPAANPAAALAAAVTDLKPRLRGFLHTYAAAVSIASGATLIAVAAALRGGRAALPTAIYAATVTLLFGISALYHRLNWKPKTRVLMKQLDHSMIFIFIAGTYTAIAGLSLPRNSAIMTLIVVWSGALVGVLLQTTWRSAPHWLGVACYLALGWVAVFVMPELLKTVGVAAFVLVIAGGLIYSGGAIVYALKKPNPVPGVFGFHEVFHACTLVAATCHYIAIWLAVFS